MVMFLWLAVAVALDNWPSLLSELEVAIRTQRDISSPIPVDQMLSFGVALSAVFARHGYTSLAISIARNLFDVRVQSILVDLYWNEFTDKWQLCPGPIPANSTSDLTDKVDVRWRGATYQCEPGLTVSDLINTMLLYIQSTNTNMDVSVLRILLNLRTISKADVHNTTKAIYTKYDDAYLSLGNTSLNGSLNGLGLFLFTPLDWANYQTQATFDSHYLFYNQSDVYFPLSDTFLLSQYKRVIALVVNNSLKSYTISSTDKNTIFTNTSLLDTKVAQSDYQCVYDDPEMAALTSHFRVVMDLNKTPFSTSTFEHYIRCGYSPILSSLLYYINESTTDTTGEIVDHFVARSLWSWADGQPDKQSGSTTVNSSEVSTGNSDSRISERCVALYDDGWQVADCYKLLPYACKHTSNPMAWVVDPDATNNYFTVPTKNDCPDNYDFSVPRLSLEMLALLEAVRSGNASFPVWVDVNDITVTNCYVSGGPYADCPYQKTITQSALAKLVAPSFAVAVAVLVMILLEKTMRVNPIQTNRKRHWRKAINEYYKTHEYEGVPS